MQDADYKKAATFLECDSRDLHFLFSKIKKLDSLNQKISPLLDPAMRKFVQVGNFANNTLILIVANGSIAMQLRFQTTKLIAQFQQDAALRVIKHIECKVRPPIPSPLEARVSHSPANPPLALSPKTAHIIHEIADGIKDEKVREILHRIATRVKEKTE